MADIGPAQYPTSPSYRAINFRIISPAVTTETMAGKLRRVGMGHTFYTFDVQYPILTYDQLLTVQTWIAVARGPLYSFEIVLPEISYSDAADAATANVTITTSANVSAGATTVSVNNCGNNKQVLMAGDFFKFANHSKVYMATAAVTSSGSGTANIAFAGGLVTSVTSGTRLTITEVPFTVVMANQQQEMTVASQGTAELEISMREVW